MNRHDVNSAKGRTAYDYLSVADGLPPAPRILPRLLALLSNPDTDVSELVELISVDPGLTSQLLRACNSAFVGLPEPASDVTEAVNRLGVSFVYQMAAAVTGSASFQDASKTKLAGMLWQDSVTSAFAADLLASDLDLDRSSLFTAALLHDFGKLVLGKQWNNEYWQLVEQNQSASSELLRLEEENYEVNHAEVGGRVLAHWKFPPAIASSVWRHHSPGPGIPYERETACINLAEVIAENVLSQQKKASCPGVAGQEAALALLGFSREDLSGYVSRAQENFQFVNAMCQIGF
jgi:putative nucleotidyltransferase with HDIG domain